MRKRSMRCLILLVTGCSFQLTGCQNEEVARFLADTLNQTAVGISSILIGGAIDQALGFTE